MAKRMNLTAARNNANLSRSQVCEALGIGENTIANYELYKTKPTIERAIQLANLYGCELDDIKWSEEE